MHSNQGNNFYKLLLLFNKQQERKINFFAKYSSCTFWPYSLIRLTANGADSTGVEDKYFHSLHPTGFAWYMSIFIDCWSSRYLVIRPYALPTCISAEIHLVYSGITNFFVPHHHFIVPHLFQLICREDREINFFSLNSVAPLLWARTQFYF